MESNSVPISAQYGGDDLNRTADEEEPALNADDWRWQLQLGTRQRMLNKVMETLKRHLPFSGQEGLQELKIIAIRFEENIYSAATSQVDYLRKISLKMMESMESIQAQGQTGHSILQQENVIGQLKQLCLSERPLSDIYSTQSGHSNGGDWKEEVYQKATSCSSSTRRLSFKSSNRHLYSCKSSNNVLKSSQNVNIDWRRQLQTGSRQRIVNKIMDSLKRRLPFNGQEGLQELKKIAMKFEETIYSAASSQSDYLRKISLKMLTMEADSSQNPLPNLLASNPALNNNRFPDPGASLYSTAAAQSGHSNGGDWKEEIYQKQGQLSQSHMQAMPQQQSQISQVQSHENPMQMQSVNMQGSVPSMVQKKYVKHGSANIKFISKY